MPPGGRREHGPLPRVVLSNGYRIEEPKMKQLAGTAMVIALLAAGPALAQSTTPQTRQNAASAGTSTPQKLDSQDRSSAPRAAGGGVPEGNPAQPPPDRASTPQGKNLTKKMI